MKHLLGLRNDLGFSISACTRDKRGRSEENGKDYYFLSPDDFKKRIDNDEFVEWEEVYPGAYYGTLKSEIQRLWNDDKNVLFDVDVKGGLKLKQYYKERALAIFVKVPNEQMLEERLRARGTESEDAISRRLFKARFEMAFQNQFDYVLVNDDLDRAFAEAQQLVEDFLKK